MFGEYVVRRALKLSSALVASASVSLVLCPVSVTSAEKSSDVSLLIVGPVEALVPKENAVVILGQKISLKSVQHINVGETAAVYGRINSDGALSVSSILGEGEYVPGATAVLLTGVVQKSNS